MFREMARMLHGAFLWAMLRFQCRIDYKKVVLVLVNDNRKLDYYAYKTCRLARKALAEYGSGGKKVRLCRCAKNTIETVYDYYSFHKFFDNIAFTYVSRPKDNLLGRVLKETQVNEEDAVCLGLYHLRTVPARASHGTS